MNSPRFTRREQVFLALAGFLFLLFRAFPSLLHANNELLFLVLVVLPLGIWIMTDRERIRSLDERN